MLAGSRVTVCGLVLTSPQTDSVFGLGVSAEDALMATTGPFSVVR